MEMIMFRMTTIAAFGFLVGVSTTLMWVQSEARTRDAALIGEGISILELHAKAASQTLVETD